MMRAAKNAGNFKLAFMGDVMLGRLVNKYLKSSSAGYVWGNSLSILGDADLRFCNLECVMSDRGRPWSATPKKFYFRSDAKNVSVLKAANINVVSLANNHVLDYEYDALLDMIETLDKAKIAHAGAGSDINVACEPAIIHAPRLTISFISFTDNEPGWKADEAEPGIFYVPVNVDDYRSALLFETVKRAKRLSDIVIVAAHWGGNWGYETPVGHRRFAKALIDSGADIIFGHSPHIFRGIELYKDSLIIYSAGDFIDDYAVDEIERNDESFIFTIQLGNSCLEKILLYPTVIRGFRSTLAGLASKSIAARMIELCSSFGTIATWSDKSDCLEIDLKL